MNWRTAKLSDIAIIERNQIDPTTLDAVTSYLGLEDIEAGGRIIQAHQVRKGDLLSAKFRFTDEHILYGKLRPYLAKISLPEFEGICSTDILPLRPKEEIDRKFLAYFLRQPEMVELANLRTTGANLPRLSPKALADFDVPFPPIVEQRRIATILSKADAIRRKYELAIVQIDQFLAAQFETLSATYQDELIDTEIGGLAAKGQNTFSNGPFGSNLLTSELTDVGVPVVYIRDIRNGHYSRMSSVFVTDDKAEELQACSVRAGDVLIAKVGDPPGIAAVYPYGEPDAIVTQDVVRLRIDRQRAEPEYIQYLLNSEYGKHVISSITVEATRARFGLGQLKKTKFEMLPVERQRIFGRMAKSAGSMRTALEGAHAQAVALQASLTQRAFRGEL